MVPKDADGIANVVDPDQAASRILQWEQTDLGLHHLPQTFCLKTLGQYEPRCEKTGFLHMRKQRRRSALR